MPRKNRIKRSERPVTNPLAEPRQKSSAPGAPLRPAPRAPLPPRASSDAHEQNDRCLLAKGMRPLRTPAPAQRRCKATSFTTIPEGPRLRLQRPCAPPWEPASPGAGRRRAQRIRAGPSRLQRLASKAASRANRAENKGLEPGAVSDSCPPVLSGCPTQLFPFPSLG